MPPNLNIAIEMMKENLGPALPPVMEKLYQKDPALFGHHLAGKQFAKPEDGALDEATRALIHLAAAVAAKSSGCARAMIHRAKALGVPDAAIKEALHIGLFAAQGATLEALEGALDEL